MISLTNSRPSDYFSVSLLHENKATIKKTNMLFILFIRLVLKQGLFILELNVNPLSKYERNNVALVKEKYNSQLFLIDSLNDIESTLLH